MSTAERIRLPDDCTIGYIVEALLGVPLIRSGLFHSHLENLQQVPASELHEQVRLLGRREPSGITVLNREVRKGCRSDTQPHRRDPAPILAVTPTLCHLGPLLAPAGDSASLH